MEVHTTKSLRQSRFYLVTQHGKDLSYKREFMTTTLYKNARKCSCDNKDSFLGLL